jgi:hypothetical protein
MMPAAEQREVRERRGASMRPVTEMMPLPEADTAAGKAATPIPMVERATQGGRRRHVVQLRVVVAADRGVGALAVGHGVAGIPRHVVGLGDEPDQRRPVTGEGRPQGARQLPVPGRPVGRAERDAALALVEVWRPVVEAARVVVEDYNAGELYFLPRLAATVDALPADTGQEANREHRL